MPKVEMMLARCPRCKNMHRTAREYKGVVYKGDNIHRYCKRCDNTLRLQRISERRRMEREAMRESNYFTASFRMGAA